MKSSGNTILITGGGSGIGEALAHRLHDSGNQLIIAGRSADRLMRAADGRPNISTMTLDIADERDITRFARQLVAEHPSLNVVVNNAGIMRFEVLDRARDLSDAEATVVTNLLGPIRLTNALVEHLSRQPNSAIVNVTSGLAFVPLVAAPTYSATKAAMHSYTVALRQALRGKIEVIELTPPAVRTELTPGQSHRAGYMALDAFIDEVMEMFARQPTPPEILVERVHFQRFAEAEGRFDRSLAEMNETAERARAAPPVSAPA